MGGTILYTLLRISFLDAEAILAENATRRQSAENEKNRTETRSRGDAEVEI